MKKYIFLVLIISGLVFPIVSSAGDLSGPLVQCGTKANRASCTFCDLFKMVQTIIDFITTGIFILAVLFIIIGGLTILFAGAVPSNLELGKKMITNAVIGVVIALLAWTVINMIFNTLVSTDKTKFPAPWNDIECKGGGVIETGAVCCCDLLSNLKTENYCKPNPFPSSAECNSGSAGCKSFCQGYAVNAGSSYQGSCCLNKKLNSNETCGGVVPATYCCCNLPDGTYSCKPDPYTSVDECNAGPASCNGYCKGYVPEYSDDCCVATKGKCGASGSCKQSFSSFSSPGCSNDCVDISSYTPTHGCESNGGKCMVSYAASRKINNFINRFNILSGGHCDLRISSTIQGPSGPSVSSCHKAGNINSGTCVDFNVSNYSVCRDYFYQAAKDTAIVSFLDEYAEACKPANATGGNIHVNF